ncbi:MAG: helix-turn-helix transcriptional regulator [Clostridiales bacterium]|nr:helix-turn-helix transcriptional regulator [Clostridiales bacterium]
MQFNEKLKQLRAQKGIPQAELAKNIYVSRSAVAKWESGLGLPSEQSLNMLAEYFGIEVSELISDPTAEKVLVTKNNTISKQKIWIISISVLAVIAVAVLITLCVCFINNPSQPIITRQLIFETEKGIDTGKINNYHDGEISVDRIFADTRTFEIEQGVSEIRLPQLLVKTTVNGDASYERVDYFNLVFSCSDTIIIRCEHDADDMDYIVVFPREYNPREFNDWANIKYGEFLISIRVFRNHIAVESITVGFSDKSFEIGLTQSKELSCDIKPYNADYTNFSYTVDSIIRPNGEKYEGDLAEYAYIQKYYLTYLTTTKNIEIGSVINIVAVTGYNDYDKVKSNVLAVTVERIAVDTINLYIEENDGYLGTTYVTIGQQINLKLFCFPVEASFNALNEQAIATLLTPETATLNITENDWIMTVSADKKNVGQEIRIKIDIPEGISKIFSWTVKGIPSESIILINLDTGEELDDVTYINRNGTLRLMAVITPENATYDKINYSAYVAELNNYGRYVRISDEGVLTVSDHAPFDMEISVSASAARGSSKVYKIIVKQVFVESVNLTCETTVIHLNEIITFTLDYSPNNADRESMKIVVLDEIDGVYISGTRIWASPNVPVGTQFSVQAIINGVESNILTFTVIE